MTRVLDFDIVLLGFFSGKCGRRGINDRKDTVVTCAGRLSPKDEVRQEGRAFRKHVKSCGRPPEARSGSLSASGILQQSESRKSMERHELGKRSLRTPYTVERVSKSNMGICTVRYTLPFSRGFDDPNPQACTLHPCREQQSS
jgi:hypothetical protein